MNDINIPPEPIEDLASGMWLANGIEDGERWNDVPEALKNAYQSDARRLLRSALSAWPGMEVKPTHLGWPAWPHIILPITAKETSHDA